MVSGNKENHARKQSELMAKIVALEEALNYEDDIAESELRTIEKRCIEVEFEIKEMKTACDETIQEQLRERKAEQKKQEKRLELANELIGQLKKENTKLRKKLQKAMEKYKEVDGTSQKIENMNSSLSNLHESVSSINEVTENKYSSLQEQHDQVKKENKQFKDRVRTQQDLYWEVAQARLEYQKGIAKILTMVQNDIDSKARSSSKDRQGIISITEELTRIALSVENEAKAEFASLEVVTAGDEFDSNTSFSQVSEVLKGDDSDPYLEFNVVQPKRR